jgi:hypothetical protein
MSLFVEHTKNDFKSPEPYYSLLCSSIIILPGILFDHYKNEHPNPQKMPLPIFTNIYSHIHSKIPELDATDWLSIPYEARVVSSDHVMDGQY